MLVQVPPPAALPTSEKVGRPGMDGGRQSPGPATRDARPCCGGPPAPLPGAFDPGQTSVANGQGSVAQDTWRLPQALRNGHTGTDSQRRDTFPRRVPAGVTLTFRQRDTVGSSRGWLFRRGLRQSPAMNRVRPPGRAARGWVSSWNPRVQRGVQHGAHGRRAGCCRRSESQQKPCCTRALQGVLNPERGCVARLRGVRWPRKVTADPGASQEAGPKAVEPVHQGKQAPTSQAYRAYRAVLAHSSQVFRKGVVRCCCRLA